MKERMINICGTEFDLEQPKSIYVNCDCMIGMEKFPDKYFDLAVVENSADYLSALST